MGCAVILFVFLDGKLSIFLFDTDSLQVFIVSITSI